MKNVKEVTKSEKLVKKVTKSEKKVTILWKTSEKSKKNEKYWLTG